jgi:hypothetical protein
MVVPWVDVYAAGASVAQHSRDARWTVGAPNIAEDLIHDPGAEHPPDRHEEPPQQPDQDDVNRNLRNDRHWKSPNREIRAAQRRINLNAFNSDWFACRPGVDFCLFKKKYFLVIGVTGYRSAISESARLPLGGGNHGD